jgi:hypothetical protein
MIHHLTAVNMLPLPQTDVIEGYEAGRKGKSKYLAYIVTACKQAGYKRDERVGQLTVRVLRIGSPLKLSNKATDIVVKCLLYQRPRF